MRAVILYPFEERPTCPWCGVGGFGTATACAGHANRCKRRDRGVVYLPQIGASNAMPDGRYMAVRVVT